MPLLRIISSAEPPKVIDPFLKDLSVMLGRALGKPESYVMVCLDPPARMLFAGSDAPTCLVEVRNVGVLTAASTERLSAEITQRISIGLGVAKSRVYINFFDVEPHMWGYDGGTFG
jgi:phenylpyruvate tautomerase